MKKLAATLIIFCLSSMSSLLAATGIELPKTMKGEVGDFVTITAKTEGKVVKWVVLDKGLTFFPSELLKDSKTTVFIGKREGTYRIGAYTSIKDEATDIAICTVTIGEPEPGPDPDPNPPDPKDPLATELSLLYRSDASPTKAADLVTLANFYKEAAKPATLAGIKTNGELKTLLSTAAGKVIALEALKSLRERLRTEYIAVFGNKVDTPVDIVLANKLFARFAAALAKVK